MSESHKEVIRKVADCAKELHFILSGLDFSPIKGPEGNIEYLLYLKKEENSSETENILTDNQIEQVVSAAHQSL